MALLCPKRKAQNLVRAVEGPRGKRTQLPGPRSSCPPTSDHPCATRKGQYPLVEEEERLQNALAARKHPDVLGLLPPFDKVLLPEPLLLRLAAVLEALEQALRTGKELLRLADLVHREPAADEVRSHFGELLALFNVVDEGDVAVLVRAVDVGELYGCARVAAVDWMVRERICQARGGSC